MKFKDFFWFSDRKCQKSYFWTFLEATSRQGRAYRHLKRWISRRDSEESRRWLSSLNTRLLSSLPASGFFRRWLQASADGSSCRGSPEFKWWNGAQVVLRSRVLPWELRCSWLVCRSLLTHLKDRDSKHSRSAAISLPAPATVSGCWNQQWHWRDS